VTVCEQTACDQANRNARRYSMCIGGEALHHPTKQMITTINGRQLYNITIRHYRGAILWAFQTWHTSTEDAMAYGIKMAAKEYADEPASVIRVSAELAV